MGLRCLTFRVNDRAVRSSSSASGSFLVRSRKHLVNACNDLSRVLDCPLALLDLSQEAFTFFLRFVAL
jgi:hypothetical protein